MNKKIVFIIIAIVAAVALCAVFAVRGCTNTTISQEQRIEAKSFDTQDVRDKSTGEKHADANAGATSDTNAAAPASGADIELPAVSGTGDGGTGDGGTGDSGTGDGGTDEGSGNPNQDVELPRVRM